MLDRGAFNGLHAAIMLHPGPADAARAEPFAVDHQHISHRGKTAHAAAYPELGVNAADAFTIAQVAIGLLRQQLPRIGAGARHRHPRRTRTQRHSRPCRGPLVRSRRLTGRTRPHRTARPRLLPSRRAGHRLRADDQAGKPALRGVPQRRTAARPVPGQCSRRPRPPIHRPRRLGVWINRASTDMGNISLRLPAIHPYLGIDSLPAVNHQPEFAAHCAGPAADRAVLDGAIALAATVIDAASRNNVRDRLLHFARPRTPMTPSEHS